jgi:hypothetical protein
VVCFSGDPPGWGGRAKQAVRVSFRLPYRCEFGQNVSIAGSISPLGGWNVGQCLDMRWTDGDVWQAELEVPALGSLGECEYKYVVRNTDGSVVTWTPGSNFALQLPPGETPGVGMPERVEVNDAWDSSWRQVQVRRKEVAAEETRQNASKLALRTAEVDNAEALEELRATVESATALLGSVDAASPEALEADRAVLQAVQKAQAASLALRQAKKMEQLGKGC